MSNLTFGTLKHYFRDKNTLSENEISNLLIDFDLNTLNVSYFNVSTLLLNSRMKIVLNVTLVI